MVQKLLPFSANILAKGQKKLFWEQTIKAVRDNAMLKTNSMLTYVCQFRLNGFFEYQSKAKKVQVDRYYDNMIRFRDLELGDFALFNCFSVLAKNYTHCIRCRYVITREPQKD